MASFMVSSFLASDGNVSSVTWLDWQRVGLANGHWITGAQLEPFPAENWLHARACNSLDLCSRCVVASRPLLRVDVPPDGAPANVTIMNVARDIFDEVGVMDGRLSGLGVGVAWSDFVDGTTSYLPLRFEVCIGTTLFGCQRLPFQFASQVASIIERVALDP